MQHKELKTNISATAHTEIYMSVLIPVADASVRTPTDRNIHFNNNINADAHTERQAQSKRRRQSHKSINT